MRSRWWQFLEVLLFVILMFVIGVVLASIINGLVCSGCEY